MYPADWVVLGLYIVVIVGIGVWANRRQTDTEAYFLGNRNMPWWAAGVSIIATSFSAASILGVPGYAYATDMWYLQYSLGDVLAAAVVAALFIPFFHRVKGLTTAYEYLEKRFDVKTRTLASLLFLFSRGMSCGVIIAAPAVILSIILGWNLTLTILAIGIPTVLYTVIGGVQAVTWTDVKQMVVIVAAVGAAIVVLILGLPEDVGIVGALEVAGAAGRLDYEPRMDRVAALGAKVDGGPEPRAHRLHRPCHARDHGAYASQDFL